MYRCNSLSRGDNWGYGELYSVYQMKLHSDSLVYSCASI